MSNENANKGGAVIVSGRQQGRNPLENTKPVTPPALEDDDERDTVGKEEQPPVFRATVDAGNDEVWVLPLRTENQVRIGVDKDGEPAYYSFVSRQKTKVPRVVIPHLERVGIIGPSIH